MKTIEYRSFTINVRFVNGRDIFSTPDGSGGDYSALTPMLSDIDVLINIINQRLAAQSNPFLGALYTAIVGYNPFIDNPGQGDNNNRKTCIEVLSSPEYLQRTRKAMSL